MIHLKFLEPASVTRFRYTNFPARGLFQTVMETLALLRIPAVKLVGYVFIHVADFIGLLHPVPAFSHFFHKRPEGIGRFAPLQNKWDEHI